MLVTLMLLALPPGGCDDDSRNAPPTAGMEILPSERSNPTPATQPDGATDDPTSQNAAVPKKDPAPGLAGIDPATLNTAPQIYMYWWQALGEDFFTAFHQHTTYDVLPEALREGLDAHPEMITACLDAAAMDCDWNIDYSMGLLTQVPHSQAVRGILRVLQAEAVRHLDDGDSPGATRCLLAMLNLCDQVDVGPGLPGHRSAMQGLHLVAATALNAFDRDRLAPGDVAVLLDALRAYDRDDPLDTYRMIEGHAQLITTTLNDDDHWRRIYERYSEDIADDTRETELAQLPLLIESLQSLWSINAPIEEYNVLAEQAATPFGKRTVITFRKIRREMEFIRDLVREAIEAGEARLDAG
jgi:hypothetical protein